MLAKRLRDTEKKLGELAKEEEQLRKRSKEAANKEDELKRLAREQERLKEKAEEQAEELRRQRNDKAADQAREAAEELARAAKEMNEGKQPEEEQKKALERLQEARREVKRNREQVEEELGRERLVRAADTLRRLAERQKTLIEQTERTQANARSQGQWQGTRALEDFKKNQVTGQEGLAQETAALVQELSGTPVFGRVVQRAAESMEQAAKRMNALVEQPPATDLLPDAATARHQKEALKRLELVLKAVKAEADAGPKQLAKEKPDGGGPNGGEGGEGGDPPAGKGQQDGLPSQEQLQLLLDWHNDAAEKLADFKRRHPDLTKLTEQETADLEAIRCQEQDVKELLPKLTQPANQPAPKEGDRK
jgi:hypothetical protein